jgi:hypothetical protein
MLPIDRVCNCEDRRVLALRSPLGCGLTVMIADVPPGSWSDPRCNRAGDRRTNTALYRIALSRLHSRQGLHP